MSKNAQRGVGVVLYVDGVAMAGQENANLQRDMSPINITNKIDASWKESIGGIKSWSLSCGGTYVKDHDSLKKLEQAFMNNEEIEVKVVMDNCNYHGKALITDFPLNAIFNTQFKYNIRLLGTGELLREDI